MPVTHGCDVSYCQSGMDYSQLRSAGVQFAWIKQVDWSPVHGFMIDSMYEKHLAGFRAQGVWCGSYAFGHVTPDPIKYADFFAEHCDQDELPPVLDLETLDNGKIPSTAGAWGLAFLKRLEQNILKTPVLYSYTNYLAAIGPTAPGLAHYPLWMAEYHQNPDRTPKAPPPFMQEKLLCHQWTGTGRLPGCPQQIDRDVLVWPLDEVLALCQNGIKAPSPSPSTSAVLASGLSVGAASAIQSSETPGATTTTPPPPS